MLESYRSDGDILNITKHMVNKYQDSSTIYEGERKGLGTVKKNMHLLPRTCYIKYL